MKVRIVWNHPMVGVCVGRAFIWISPLPFVMIRIDRASTRQLKAYLRDVDWAIHNVR